MPRNSSLMFVIIGYNEQMNFNPTFGSLPWRWWVGLHASMTQRATSAGEFLLVGTPLPNRSKDRGWTNFDPKPLTKLVGGLTTPHCKQLIKWKENLGDFPNWKRELNAISVKGLVRNAMKINWSNDKKHIYMYCTRMHPVFVHIFYWTFTRFQGFTQGFFIVNS